MKDWHECMEEAQAHASSTAEWLAIAREIHQAKDPLAELTERCLAVVPMVGAAVHAEDLPTYLETVFSSMLAESERILAERDKALAERDKAKGQLGRAKDARARAEHYVRTVYDREIPTCDTAPPTKKANGASQEQARPRARVSGGVDS